MAKYFNTSSPRLFSPSRLLLKCLGLGVAVKLFGYRQQVIGVRRIRERDMITQQSTQAFDYNFNRRDDFILQDILNDRVLDVKNTFQNEYLVMFYGSFSLFLKT